ncbi:PH domain-containing protein [Okeania sp. SIO2B3]|uniref:PH domain-containing protein n=1 Tax=Okeania sp. SIO2B3 TaxID=2607784 RepID=UPI0013C03224|nr:PH domain-containing protein [Okeania sp. SIO2B3]NET46433.1 PH domain-containing protein [Okeania sp. SIO2B3]
MEVESCRVHPSMWRSNPLLFIVYLCLILLFGIGLIFLLIWWIKSKNTTLIVTDKRTFLQQGLLSRYTNEVMHAHIRNIQVQQSMMECLFNTGTIKIASAGTGDIEITVSGIPAPNRIKEVIDHYRL